jgi:hypothetical protein
MQRTFNEPVGGQPSGREHGVSVRTPRGDRADFIVGDADLEDALPVRANFNSPGMRSASTAALTSSRPLVPTIGRFTIRGAPDRPSLRAQTTGRPLSPEFPMCAGPSRTATVAAVLAPQFAAKRG